MKLIIYAHKKNRHLSTSRMIKIGMVSIPCIWNVWKSYGITIIAIVFRFGSIEQWEKARLATDSSRYRVCDAVNGVWTELCPVKSDKTNRRSITTGMYNSSVVVSIAHK